MMKNVPLIIVFFFFYLCIGDAGKVHAANSNRANPRTSCPENQYYNEVSNRCENTPLEENRRNTFTRPYLDCTKEENRDERRECFATLAREAALARVQEELGHNTDGFKLDPEEDGYRTQHLERLQGTYVGLGVMNALTAVVFSFVAGSKSPLCMSHKILAAANLASWIPLGILNAKTNEEIDKMTAEFTERHQNEGIDFEAQRLAFEYLIHQQDLVKSHAEVEGAIYTAIAVAFAAASVAGIAETTGLLTPSCAYNGAFKENGSSTEVDLLGNPRAANLAYLKNLRKLSGSQAVATLGAVGAGAAGVLAHFAFDSGAKAGARKEVIEGILNNFDQYIGGLCTERDKVDERNVTCYCYDAERKPLPNRQQSEICRGAHQRDERNFYVSPESYGTNEGPGLVCINVNGNIDRNCECRHIKIRGSNRNACLKNFLGTGGIAGGRLGNALAGGPLNGVFNDGFSGGVTGGTLNSLNALGSAAAAIRKAREQVSNSINAKRKAEGKAPLDPLFKKEGEKIVSALRAREGQQAAGANSSLSLSARLQDQLDSSAKANKGLSSALDTVNKKIAYRKGGLAASEQKNTQDPFALDFANERSPANNLETFQKNAPSYDYGDTEISHRDEHIIWDIISKRYYKSALPRLFAE